MIKKSVNWPYVLDIKLKQCTNAIIVINIIWHSVEKKKERENYILAVADIYLSWFYKFHYTEM